jgi:hypothetical protein
MEQRRPCLHCLQRVENWRELLVLDVDLVCPPDLRCRDGVRMARQRNGGWLVDRRPAFAWPLVGYARLRGAVMSCKRKGLRIIHAGGRAWILAADWIRYLDRIGEGKDG